MSRRRIKLQRKVKEIIASAKEKLTNLNCRPAGTKEALRGRIALLIALNRDLRELSLHHSQQLLSKDSASERILDYLRLRLGEPVEGEEVDVVSTISEYPRRIREWRVEAGWPIVKEGSNYVLKRDEPDGDKADRWRKMNAIRRTDAAARDKMLALLRAYPHRRITRTELQYVSKNADMRRVRELRTEFGWRIMTRNTGMPELKPAEYVLVDPDPAEEHDRHIDEKTVIKTLKRDGNRCQKAGCHWHPADRAQGDPRQYIEIHHVTWHSKGGANKEENLITLCNVHHKDLHREKVGPDRFQQWINKPD
jgi:hypothetical protein